MAHLIQNLLFTVYIGAMQWLVFKFVLLATPCLSFPSNQRTPKEARLARPVQPKQLLSVSFVKRLLQILPLNRDVFYLEYVHVIVLCRFMCPCKRKVDLYGTLRPCPVTVTQCFIKFSCVSISSKNCPSSILVRYIILSFQCKCFFIHVIQERSLRGILRHQLVMFLSRYGTHK